MTAWEGDGVRLESGERVPRQSLVVSTKVRRPFCGARIPRRGPRTGGGQRRRVGAGVPADPTGRTATDGVWVAGNVSNVMAQVIGAAAAGMMAGAAINADLVAEDARRAVERHKLTSEEGWDEKYRSHPTAIWSGNPNPALVEAATDLSPGRALDVGCGEGADALWLAERGWTVDAADISSVALGRAAARARERNLELNWRHADLVTDPPEPDAYDLVNAQFLQLPRRTTEAVRGDGRRRPPGGTLLIVAHHPSDLTTSVRRPHLLEMFYTADELASDLDQSVGGSGRRRPPADRHRS